MSDQTPDLDNAGRIDGRNLINIAGSGIVSINGDNTPAQTITAGTGINVANGGGGAHTISTAALLSVNGDTTQAQTLVAGTGINVVDGGGGAHTISTPALLSINADTTQAQTLVAGTNVTIVDGGGGAHTINAAVAPSQVTGSAVLNAAINDVTWTNGASVLVPATKAHYHLNVRGRFHNAATTNAAVRVTVNGVPQDFYAACETSPGGAFPDIETAPCFAAITGALTIGDTITVQGFQNTGGPITFDSFIEIASVE